MFDIAEIKPGNSTFELFLNFPREIYPADSLRFKTPETFDSEYLVSCFVLLSEGKVQARAALYDNPHLYYQHKKAWCIGNYESANDDGVAAALLLHIATQAKKRGAQFITGPMNGSTWDTYRFSIHHNHPHFFPEPFHHLYYNKHFANAGFDVIAKYFSSIDRDLKFDNTAVAKRQDELIQAGVTFRNINLADFEQELEKVFDFNALAFSANFLYTPVSKKSFIQKYQLIKALINPEFAMIAEDARGTLIGYFFCLDDFYNQKEKSLIIKTVARHPDKKWSGTGHVMAAMIFKKAIDKQYTSIIHSFMHEEGSSVTMSKNFLGTVFKNYFLYGKEL